MLKQETKEGPFPGVENQRQVCESGDIFSAAATLSSSGIGFKFAKRMGESAFEIVEQS